MNVLDLVFLSFFYSLILNLSLSVFSICLRLVLKSIPFIIHGLIVGLLCLGIYLTPIHLTERDMQIAQRREKCKTCYAYFLVHTMEIILHSCIVICCAFLFCMSSDTLVSANPCEYVLYKIARILLLHVRV